MAGVCSTPGCPELVTSGQCTDCRRATSRAQHRTVPTKATRTWDERQRRAQAVKRWRTRFGDWCPIDGGHDVDPPGGRNPLTAHHVQAVAAGGDPHGELMVVCRSHNSSIGARTTPSE